MQEHSSELMSEDTLTLNEILSTGLGGTPGEGQTN